MLKNTYNAALANTNLFDLSRNRYPGRIIIVGLDSTGQNLVQLYAIMGRSENSRNRVFGQRDGCLFTEAADESKVKDPSLIIYTAMDEIHHNGLLYAVVSNGSQTGDIVHGFGSDQSMHTSLSIHTFEPDKPNYTSRISAASWWRPHEDSMKPVIQMSILRKSSLNDECDRHMYEVNGICEGYGYGFSTYSGDGDPLPQFSGDPQLFPLIGDEEAIADVFWKKLNPDNRVSLAVKFIAKNGGRSRIHIINKYSKV